MKHFQKIISSMLTVLMSVALSGIGLASTASASAQLTAATATLTDPSSGVSTTHKLDFHIATTGNIGEIDFQYANTATGSTVPTGLVTTSSTKTSILNGAGVETGTWTIVNGVNGLIGFTRAPGSYTAADYLHFTIGGISNNTNTGGGQCDSITDSDSCFIQIRTYAVNSSGSVIDQSTVTYTIVNPVTVSATVDPILLFTVAGVASGSLAGHDANYGGTGTTTTSTSTALVFGNITVGTPKLAQQQLNTETNANNGYFVYQRFLGANLMIGSANSSNNIDPFTEGGATWGTPLSWASPTGSTASVNTAELGLRTTDTDVSGFNSSGVYGPPTLTANGNSVMQSGAPDNGSSAVYVTYKIEANAFQPADSYSGSMVYSVVASY